MAVIQVHESGAYSDPVARLHDVALSFASDVALRTKREPDVEVRFSNRPRYRFRVFVGGIMVAEGRNGAVERAARETLVDFERWMREAPPMLSVVGGGS